MRADLLVLWAWEYDAEFMDLLRRACVRHDVRATFVDAHGMSTLAQKLDAGDIAANTVLDRVWDWGEEYEAHVPAVLRHVPHALNPYDKVREIWNKPAVHYLLMRHGIHVPHTLILPRFDHVRDLAPVDLEPLQGRFSVKGAHSGGSGVLRPAATWEDVLQRRTEWPHDETLIQRWVEPRLLGNRRAWFRMFYACGAVFACWQDDRTHIQQPVLASEEKRFGLDALRVLTAQIAGLCQLSLFSTEIALDDAGNWVVVDYVNDPCDYRPKSTVTNGVPDEHVHAIAERIAVQVRKLSIGTASQRPQA
jgi:hypothetical protein